jgi:hypothetical protein
MKKRRSSAGPASVPNPRHGAVAVPVPASVEASATAPLCFGVSLLVALAATLPAFTGVVDGSTTLVTAAARFLTVAVAAFVLAQVLVFVFPRRAASVGDGSAARREADGPAAAPATAGGVSTGTERVPAGR